MFAPRKPDAKKAYKELRANLVMFGTMVVTIRVAPYLLHLYQQASS